MTVLNLGKEVQYQVHRGCRKMCGFACLSVNGSETLFHKEFLGSPARGETGSIKRKCLRR